MKNIPISKRPLLARVIFSHVKVLAHDEQNNLVLTDRDLNAMVEYLVFWSSTLQRDVLSENSCFSGTVNEVQDRFGNTFAKLR